jgi:hypothetical protein
MRTAGEAQAPKGASPRDCAGADTLTNPWQRWPKEAVA